MGVIVADGIVTQVPYALIKNINQALQPVAVVLFGATGNLRGNPIHNWSLRSAGGIPIYLNEKVKFIYRAPLSSSNAQVCDLWRVNPGTGAETLDSTVSLNALRQKAVTVLITAIDGSSGALTTTVTYDV